MTQPSSSTILAGKIALVTGSSRGIGAATALRLAADGASVLVHYGTNGERAEAIASMIRDRGGEAETVQADLTTAEGSAKLIAALDRAFKGRFAGRLDVLVNNAGTGHFSALPDATDEDFDRQFHLNVRAPFQLAREASRRMIAAGWGRIVNVGSCLGERVPLQNGSIYCATKFAIHGFTRAWSRDLGAKNITVNCVQPGPIDTDLNPADGDSADSQRAQTSVGRYGKPEEVAAAIAFLCDPKSSFINGENLTVDGGWSA